jgi:ParB-like chromosome segregation protein Spo0J
MFKEVKIADIKLGKRFRKDMGELKPLAESIQHDGLGITNRFELVFCERRL